MAPKKANKQAPAGKKGAEKMAGAGAPQGAGTKRSRKELEATEGDDNDQEMAMKAQNTSTGRAAGGKDAADAGRASVDGEQADGPPHRSAVINANPLSETGPESSSNGGGGIVRVGPGASPEAGLPTAAADCEKQHAAVAKSGESQRASAPPLHLAQAPVDLGVWGKSDEEGYLTIELEGVLYTKVPDAPKLVRLEYAVDSGFNHRKMAFWAATPSTAMSERAQESVHAHVLAVLDVLLSHTISQKVALC